MEGELGYFENRENSSHPFFIEASMKPFNGLNIINVNSPSLADFDEDGYFDVIIG